MADTTRAAAPGKEGQGKEGTILGLPTKTAVIVGAVVIVGGYLWMKYHSSSSSSSGSGGGSGSGGQKHGPTGTSRQTLTVWVKQHGGHRGH